MICFLPCLIASIFFIANLYLIMSVDTLKETREFMAVLEPDLQIKYSKIISERRRIYMTGMFLGTIISTFVILSNRKKLKPMQMACVAGSTVFMTTFLYYMISPKSDYILPHLTKDLQRIMWLRSYKIMQKQWYFGLALGIFSTMLFTEQYCETF